MFTEFAGDYYGVDPLTVSNFVDITYKEEFPIFYRLTRSLCVDTSKFGGYQDKNASCGKCGSKCMHSSSAIDECNILVCKYRFLISTAVDVGAIR